MKVKYAIFAVFVAFLVLTMNSGLQAVNTREIDGVRSKPVLDDEDFQIIDNFIAEAVQKLVKTKDFTSVAKVRSDILSHSSSATASAAAQYSGQFSKSAHKYISLGLEQASGLTPEDRKIKVILNLLILVDSLEDLQLADLAIELLNDENTVIRYWAVHSVTNPGVTEQLNSGKSANLKLAAEVVEQLEELVDSSGSEIIALMAEFAADVNIPQAEDLLLQIADMRISKYADWTVDYELLDATVLKLLCGKMSSVDLSKPLPATSRRGEPAVARPAPQPASRRGWARRFGQLYSYAIQRYIKDINEGDFLSAAKKQQLASVLVETEDKCIGKLLRRRQLTIKKAVERGDYIALLREHNRLLGDETKAGELALKLDFDYGQTSDGAKRTAPLALPEPPKKSVIDD